MKKSFKSWRVITVNLTLCNQISVVAFWHKVPFYQKIKYSKICACKLSIWTFCHIWTFLLWDLPLPLKNMFFLDILLISAYLKISYSNHYCHYRHYRHYTHYWHYRHYRDYRHHSYNNHHHRLLWCKSTKQTITRSLSNTSGYTNHCECFLSSLWLDCVPIQGPVREPSRLLL